MLGKSAHLLVGALLVALLGCRAGEEPRPCPSGFARDSARAKGLLEALKRSDEGARLLERAPAPDVCFGAPALSVVTTDKVFLMDARLDEAEGAARFGHLLSHVVLGMPDPKPGDAGCDAAVEEALRSEAAALALELRLRRALGVEKPRIVLEPTDAFWAAPPSDRETLLFEYLRAHPDGAPGIDALAAGYARRCNNAR